MTEKIRRSNMDFLFGRICGAKRIYSFKKAPFQYPGGKAKFVRQVVHQIPLSKSFVDVFGGSGVVTLNVGKRELNVYNDRYAGVYSFYKCISNRKRVLEMIEILEAMPHSIELFHDNKDYLEKHGLDFENDVHRAAMWYHNVLMSYSGISGSWGYATHSMGLVKRYQNKIKRLPEIYNIVVGCQIDNLDFRECIRKYDGPDTVFYLDPPYLDTECRFAHVMDEKDHKDLLELISKSQGYFVVSHYVHPLYKAAEWDDIKIDNKKTTAGPDRYDMQEAIWIRKYRP